MEGEREREREAQKRVVKNRGRKGVGEGSTDKGC